MRIKPFIYATISALIASTLFTTMTYANDTLEYTLDNGLKVFLIHDPSASLISARTYVRAGSINEDPYLGTGISHYLEHIVAGGTTTKRVEDSYQSKISELGGAFNAYTTTDHTSYYINTIPSELNEALSMLYEWMFYCSFDKREVSREKEVIIREIEKNNASVPRQFYSMAQHNFYKYHPSRLPVIGYLDKFKSLERNDLVNYYNRHYTPSNMILVVGGRLNIPKVKASIESTFGSIPRLSHPPTNTLFPEPRAFAPRVVERKGNTSTTLVSIRFSTIDLFHDDLYSLDLLDFILGNGDDSILYRTLVEDEKVAYSVNTSSYTPPMTTGFFEVSAEVDYDKKEAFISRVMDILTEVKGGALSKDQIARAKKQKIAEDIFSVDTMEDKVTRMGQAYLYGHSSDFFETYVDSFKSITERSIVDAANRYFKPQHMVTTIMKPQNTAEPQLSDEGLSTSVKRPELEVLKNGVRVIFYHDSSLPRVHSKIVALGGLRAESKETNGIGALAAENIGKQSKHYPKKAIQTIIEDNGANLDATIGNNTIYCSLTALQEDFLDLLPVQIDSFINPVFTKTDMDEAKRQIKNAIEKRPDSWFGYGRYNFKKGFYGVDHPYGFSSLGELDNITKITPTQVEYHHQSLLVPTQMVVTVFGDYDKDTVLALLNKKLGKLKAPDKAFDQIKTIPTPKHTALKEVETKITQDVAAIFIGFDGITIGQTEEHLKLDLLDAVMSGMSYPGGRLHKLLRDKGLVYLVHGGNFVGLDGGNLIFYALTSKPQLADVQKHFMDQFQQIANGPVTDEEFKQAIAQLDYFYKDQHSSLDALSIVTATDELYGLGYDHYLSLESDIAKLKKSDVQAIAKKYLKSAQIYTFK